MSDSTKHTPRHRRRPSTLNFQPLLLNNRHYIIIIISIIIFLSLSNYSRSDARRSVYNDTGLMVTVDNQQQTTNKPGCSPNQLMSVKYHNDDESLTKSVDICWRLVNVTMLRHLYATLVVDGLCGTTSHNCCYAELIGFLFLIATHNKSQLKFLDK